MSRAWLAETVDETTQDTAKGRLAASERVAAGSVAIRRADIALIRSRRIVATAPDADAQRPLACEIIAACGPARSPEPDPIIAG
jgi:hypothetical protein